MPAASPRCANCLLELVAVRPLPLREARLLARPDVRVWRRRRYVPSPGRAAALAAMLALLLYGAWWGYANFVRQVPPLPTPLGALAVSPPGATWGAARGGAEGLGQTPATLGAPKRGWQVELHTLVPAAPVADAERLFVPLDDNRLHALSLSDGRDVWAYDATVPLAGSPLLAGDRVYVANRRCEMVALAAADGRVLWRVQGVGQAYSGPTLARGVVYQQCTREVAALDAEDGRRRWGYALPDEAILAAPSTDGVYLAVQSDGAVHLFDVKTGAHTFAYPQSATRALAIDSGVAYAVTARFVAALDTSSRSPWWEGLRAVRLQLWIWGLTDEPPRPPARWITQVSPSHDAQFAGDELFPPAFDAERIYLANRDGLMRVYDRVTGELLYEIDAGSITGAPLRAGDALLLSTKGHIEQRDPASGVLRSTLPVEGDGLRYYVVTTQGLFVVNRQGGAVTAYR